MKLLEIKDSDLNFGIIYTGNMSQWFPDIDSERIQEYNNFINGFVAIHKKLELERGLYKNILATYASITLFTDAEDYSRSLFSFDFKTDSHSNESNIHNISSRLKNSFIQTIKDESSDVESKIDSFYNSILAYTRSELKNLKFDNVLEIVYKDKKVKFPDLKVCFNSVQNDYSLKFSGFKHEKIAGNSKAKKSLISIMDRLLFYDIEKKHNPLLDVISFPKVTTLIGSAGTGKTMLITQALNYLTQKCSELNKPFHFISIDSDTKSEYKSLSERQLKKKFDLAYSGKGIYALLIEEIDTKIFSRNNIDAKNSAELSFTGTFLESIEGLNKYLGNFVVITTANRRLNPDSAIKRRLMENIIYVEGLEKTEDHILVFKNKLKKGIEGNYIKIKNWNEIGNLSKKYNFQGGDIKNVCSNLNNDLLSLINCESYDNVGKVIAQIPVVNESFLIKSIKKYLLDSKKFNKDFLEVL